eukprot:Gb_24721 [translate_table: standard]
MPILLSFCAWTGVNCSSRRQRVVELRLTNVDLEGSISPHLRNLSFLKAIYLFNNRLGGHLPQKSALELYNNQFEGVIPQEFGRLTNLNKLYLSDNQGEEGSTQESCKNHYLLLKPSLQRLELNERVNIAIDVAHGIEYLHYDSSVQVVHCNIKLANVLLDEDLTAPVADFGIARLAYSNSMHSFSSTLALKGSVGYIAPEYGVGGGVSAKGGRISYGVLLLEMFTKKGPIDEIEKMQENEVQYKHSLGNSGLHLALLCTDESPHDYYERCRGDVGSIESIFCSN